MHLSECQPRSASRQPWLVLLFLAVALLPSSRSLAGDAAPAAIPGPGAFNAAVEEWLALRREVNRLRADWVREKALIDSEQRLLSQQREFFEQKQAEHAQAARAMEDRLAETRLRLAALRAGQAQIEKPLAEIGRKLEHEWRLFVPELGNSPGLAALREIMVPPPAGLDLRARLQRTVAACAQLAQAGDSLHAGTLAMRAPDGRELEMPVLLLGLGAGLALAPDNLQAAAGWSEPGGWQWQWDAALAPAARAAFKCYRRDLPAGFVTLPLPAAAAEVSP